MIRRTFKFRIYPTKRQTEDLDFQLAEACRLYNAALQERRDAWRINRVSINYFNQSEQLKYIRAAGDCALSSFDVCQEVLRRLDKNFKTFFSRRKRGLRAGSPRFRPLS